MRKVSDGSQWILQHSEPKSEPAEAAVKSLLLWQKGWNFAKRDAFDCIRRVSIAIEVGTAFRKCRICASLCEVVDKWVQAMGGSSPSGRLSQVPLRGFHTNTKSHLFWYAGSPKHIQSSLIDEGRRIANRLTVLHRYYTDCCSATCGG